MAIPAQGHAVVDICPAVLFPPMVDVVVFAFGGRSVAAGPDAAAIARGDPDALPAGEQALLASEVEGSIAVITPRRWQDRLTGLDGAGDGRVQVIDPLSTKGLEYDATVVVDPEAIVAESPGGVRVLYVAMTRAAHRMTVLRP